MNTERLYELLEKVRREVVRVGVTEKLDELIQHITNQVNEPQNGAHQTGFSQALTQLRARYQLSWFMQLTPLETDVLEKIGLGILIGRRLPARLVELVRNNGMLPAVVRDALTQISTDLKTQLGYVATTIKSFEQLGLDEGGLAPGVGELALKIPREGIDESFSSFIEDAKFLDALVGTSVEIVEGKHDKLTLKSLASSDYNIALEVAPQVVAFVVLAIERVMAGYKTVLEIRVLRDQLKARQAPDAAIASIEEDIEKRVKEIARKGLDEALKEMKLKLPSGRGNEVKTHAASLFRKLVEKLENGYDLDGRVGHEEIAPEDEQEKAEHEQLVAIDRKVRLGIKVVRKQISESKNLKALEYQPETTPAAPSASDEDSETGDE